MTPALWGAVVGGGIVIVVQAVVLVVLFLSQMHKLPWVRYE